MKAARMQNCRTRMKREENVERLVMDNMRNLHFISHWRQLSITCLAFPYYTIVVFASGFNFHCGLFLLHPIRELQFNFFWNVSLFNFHMALVHK